MAYPLLDFVLPSVCLACGSRLGARQRLGACADCWCGLRVLRPPLCPACGLPRPAGTDLVGPARGRCARCILEPPAADAVRAAVAYDRVARALLLRAKLGRSPELFEPLGLQLARALECGGYARGCSAVVPVPSHPWMNLRRGFEPARALARPLARRLGLPLRRGVLRRRLAAPLALKRLGRGRRQLLVAGSFRVRVGLAGQRLLLVDDVMTTGASADACARALKRAGASEVRVAVWARTLPDV